ncbi:MAG: SurA N-terminal domain-containing protein [Actinomycetota bacterium]
MKKVFGAILAVAALLLSGCSQVDSAATVGETKIELSELQTQIDTILAERKDVDTSQMQLETGEALTRSQLAYMISNLIIDEVAKSEKIEVSNSDLEAYKVEIYANIGGEANLPNILVNASIPSTGLEEVLRRDLVLRKLSERETAAGGDSAAVNEKIQGLVTEMANKLKVSVNPRYGTWDPTTLTVVAAEPAGDAVTDK